MAQLTRTHTENGFFISKQWKHNICIHKSLVFATDLSLKKSNEAPNKDYARLIFHLIIRNTNKFTLSQVGF